MKLPNPFSQFNLLSAGLLMFSVASAVLAGHFYMRLTALQQDPQQAAQEEQRALIARIGELIILPGDETPTIVTVSDPEKLRTQPFFARARAGDKVLIFNNAKKAILYNPESNKIIEVAPLNFETK